MTAQNKETYLESMNEEYKQKHYPEGSVFKAHKKAMKGVNAGLGLFFMGAFLAGSIAGLVWSINRTLEIVRSSAASDVYKRQGIKRKICWEWESGFRFSFFCWWRYSE